ncbi:MAG TPA: class I SAM-dependent methyltransferase [Streptosporangiaceae bacterium]|nr:class I SAM-dependent methyltransferase [Streptosporangiaceae bacterium]
MVSPRSFEDLVAEGASVPVEGWDFSWFDGRASEDRPPWGYAAMAAARVSRASSVLDVQTGGGEVFRWALEHASARPPALAATEAWPPNLEVARRTLSPFGVRVAHVAEDAALPFGSEAFDLVISRHPVCAFWPEIARVLRPGGTYFSQEVGPGSNRELTDFLMGPQPVDDSRRASTAVRAAEAAGLVVTDLREATLRMEFLDIGAVVHFLRKVIWTVPDFDADRYRDRLLALHSDIEQSGSFVCHSRRFLIEAKRPQAPSA